MLLLRSILPHNASNHNGHWFYNYQFVTIVQSVLYKSSIFKPEKYNRKIALTSRKIYWSTCLQCIYMVVSITNTIEPSTRLLVTSCGKWLNALVKWTNSIWPESHFNRKYIIESVSIGNLPCYVCYVHIGIMDEVGHMCVGLKNLSFMKRSRHFLYRQ